MVQVNGKVRFKFTAQSSAKDTLEGTAMGDERIDKWIADKTIRKVIVIPHKLINVVVS